MKTYRVGEAIRIEGRPAGIHTVYGNDSYRVEYDDGSTDRVHVSMIEQPAEGPEERESFQVIRLRHPEDLSYDQRREGT